MLLSEILSKYGDLNVSSELAEKIIPTERYKPEYDGQYWSLSGGRIFPATWKNDQIDQARYQRGNCFMYQAQAQAQAADTRDIIRQELIEAGASEFFNPDGLCWEMALWPAEDQEDAYIDAVRTDCAQPYSLYFESEEAVERAVKQVGKDRILQYLLRTR